VIAGHAFYRLINALGGLSLPRNIATVRLMTRRYVRALLLHTEREVMIAGLWVLTGFKQVAVPIIKSERNKPSHYGSVVKLRLVMDHITAFSGNLLYYVFYAGTALALLSFAMMAFQVIRYLITHEALAGWTSLMASIWMFGGLTILLLGLIGIYLARIFEETKHRPYVIVRELYGRASNNALPASPSILQDNDNTPSTIPHP
jgi:putative glycosyltransferase